MTIRNVGGFLGTTPTTPSTQGGSYLMREQFNYQLSGNWSGVVRSNLILYLDAGNTSSYPGTGTVWYDLSGNGNHYSILSTAYNSSGPKYMDFNGSYGVAKNLSGTTDISLSDATGVTYVLATRIKNSSSDWRTLTRSWVADHHVIVQSGGWAIGMYDNDGGNFQSTGYSQQSLPNYNTTNWIIMYWRWQNISPYYQFSFNDTPGTIRGSLTSTSARYNRGFGALGGASSDSTNNPANGTQFWGDISVFLVYDRFLTDAELTVNYLALRTRYGL